MKRNHSKNRIDSFGHAFEGIFAVFRTEPNVRIHLAATAAVVIMGGWLKVGINGWGLLVFAISIVWIAELMNSAVEYTVDLVTEDYHEKAKLAKDMAAGGVLIAAIAAAVIGLLVLGPPLFSLLFG